MKSIRIILRSTTLSLIGLSFWGGYNSFAQKSNKAKKNGGYSVAAYVWPSCHHDKRFGDMLWPEGTGEWEVIKKGI